MDREAIIVKVNTDTSSSGTEVTTMCQSKLDWIQDDICSRYDFSWLKKYGYVNTTIVYDTGTVTCTTDSTTLTGLGTTFTAAMVGRLFKVDDEESYYTISAYVSTTELTLASTYIGTTAATLSYNIYKTDYPLATDFKKMLWVKQVVTNSKLINIPETIFNDYYPDMFIRGEDITADSYSLTGIDSDGYYTIRLSPIQTTRKQLYYQYIKQLTTINTTGASSSIPTKWHDAFVFMCNVFVFNMIDIPQKAQIYNTLYEQTIARMIEEDSKRDKSLSYVMANERLSRGRNNFVRFDPTHFENNR